MKTQRIFHAPNTVQPQVIIMSQAEAQPSEVIRGAWMRTDELLRKDPAGASMEAAINVVADLRHWCDAQGIDFDQVIAQADEAYNADRNIPVSETPPPAPAARVLGALNKARPILVRQGVPTATLNQFERALIDGINEQFASAKPARRPAADEFEQSVIELARDQWGGAMSRDLQRGSLTIEQVYNAAIDRVGGAGIFGPNRTGAIQAIERFCREHHLQPGPELAALKEPVKPQKLSDRLRAATGSRMGVR